MKKLPKDLQVINWIGSLFLPLFRNAWWYMGFLLFSSHRKSLWKSEIYSFESFYCLFWLFKFPLYGVEGNSNPLLLEIPEFCREKPLDFCLFICVSDAALSFIEEKSSNHGNEQLSSVSNFTNFMGGVFGLNGVPEIKRCQMIVSENLDLFLFF